MVFLLSTAGGSFEQIHEIMQEILSAPDRSAAIVGGSLLERILTDRIIEHLHQDKKIADELFRPSGALGPFANKIRLAKLVGVCGPSLYADLNYIKDIRNKFAHQLEVRSFDDPQIKGWCGNLALCDKHTVDARNPGEGHGHWAVGIEDRAMLSHPRGRFIASLSVCSYAINMGRGAKMPVAPI